MGLRKPFWALVMSGLTVCTLALAGDLSWWALATGAGALIAQREMEGKPW